MFLYLVILNRKIIITIKIQFVKTHKVRILIFKTNKLVVDIFLNFRRFDNQQFKFR